MSDNLTEADKAKIERWKKATTSLNDAFKKAGQAHRAFEMVEDDEEQEKAQNDYEHAASRLELAKIEMNLARNAVSGIYERFVVAKDKDEVDEYDECYTTEDEDMSESCDSDNEEEE
jgi:ferric-dicitrate binding protein FerR (iron transport regulator)